MKLLALATMGLASALDLRDEASVPASAARATPAPIRAAVSPLPPG